MELPVIGNRHLMDILEMFRYTGAISCREFADLAEVGASGRPFYVAKTIIDMSSTNSWNSKLFWNLCIFQVLRDPFLLHLLDPQDRF